MIQTIDLKQYQTVRSRHWLPLLTICPVTKYIDFNYIELETYGNNTVEIMAWRKEIFKHKFKSEFLEDLVYELSEQIPKEIKNYTIYAHTVFSSHSVKYERVE